MNFRTLFLSVTLVLGLFSCQSVDKQPEILTKEKPSAPVAEKRDSVLTIHNDTRVDPYFWMRLSDEQKVAETPDAQT
jgi:oligopeptidase B